MNLACFIRFLAQMNNFFCFWPSRMKFQSFDDVITNPRWSIDFSFAWSKILRQWFATRIGSHFNMSPVDGVKETKHQKIQISEVEIWKKYFKPVPSVEIWFVPSLLAVSGLSCTLNIEYIFLIDFENDRSLNPWSKLWFVVIFGTDFSPRR